MYIIISISRYIITYICNQCSHYVYVLNYLMYILIISQSYQTMMYNLVNNVLIEVY